MNPRPVVLAVDDEHLVLTTFVRNFRREFDIRTAPDAAVALEILAREAIDIVLSDYAMPGLNGLELLARTAEVRPGALRILSTAHTSAPEVLDARASGLFAALIEKPWTRAVILDTIEKARLQPTG